MTEKYIEILERFISEYDDLLREHKKKKEEIEKEYRKIGYSIFVHRGFLDKHYIISVESERLEVPPRFLEGLTDDQRDAFARKSDGFYFGGGSHIGTSDAERELAEKVIKKLKLGLPLVDPKETDVIAFAAERKNIESIRNRFDDIIRMNKIYINDIRLLREVFNKLKRQKSAEIDYHNQLDSESIHNMSWMKRFFEKK